MTVARNPIFTQSELRALLHYDPLTGEFTNLVSRRNAPAGTKAGSYVNTGYISIGIRGAHVLAHRLAWFYVHGEWPKHQVDHFNRVRSDNRLSNLRLATKGENMQNTATYSNNTSGYKGVSPHDDKWVAHISHNGTQHYLGVFADAEDAARVRAEAADRLHKFNTVSAAAQ